MVLPEDRIPTKSVTELAVEAIPIELLRKCPGMPDPATTGLPPNNIGALLSDSTEAMSLLAECIRRQHALVDYIRPIAYQERRRVKQ